MEINDSVIRKLLNCTDLILHGDSKITQKEYGIKQLINGINRLIIELLGLTRLIHGCGGSAAPGKTNTRFLDRVI